MCGEWADNVVSLCLCYCQTVTCTCLICNLDSTGPLALLTCNSLVCKGLLHPNTLAYLPEGPVTKKKRFITPGANVINFL
jgi:hypothetical protein